VNSRHLNSFPLQYGCNLFAETRKAANKPLTPRMRLVTEVGLPFLSVSLLISVTFYVTFEATLILLEHKFNDDVDVVIMYAFATINFFVDVICTALFHVRGKTIFHAGAGADGESDALTLTDDNSEDLGDAEEQPDHSFVEPQNSPTKNLNMISAFFHIGGDTLRTIAIFGAALVSTTTNSNPDYCDAWAAIAVSITIFFLAVPMLFAIFGHLKTLASTSSDGEDRKFLAVSSPMSDMVDSHIEMHKITPQKV
jgi:Co/Zn/Cd efflux system component